MSPEDSVMAVCVELSTGLLETSKCPEKVPATDLILVEGAE